jgi:hypothetical protein
MRFPDTATPALDQSPGARAVNEIGPFSNVYQTVRGVDASEITSNQLFARSGMRLRVGGCAGQMACVSFGRVSRTP